jgi:hypothetical protein
MMKLLQATTITLILTLPTANALVDYSDSASTVNETPAITTTASAPKMQSVVSSPKPTGGQNLVFDLIWETIDITLEQSRAKVQKGSFNIHYQTPFDVYADLSYWMASSDHQRLATDDRWSAGNPSAKLGLNWLRLGGNGEEAAIDFFAGGMLQGQENSSFASSRNDFFFGAETSKQFGQFMLGLGAEGRLTGTPSRRDEGDIGNVQKIIALFAWRAAPNIRFAMEGARTAISANPKANVTSVWSQKNSWTYLAPQLELALGPSLGFNMGALFPIKNIVLNDEWINARLWELRGAYGSSLYACLNAAF